ncbi:MAG TPA: hypothetical protein PKD90_10580, partial [Phnomibacter sp.]|nr:hypothetical protein [Phnomibacter sp.]
QQPTAQGRLPHNAQPRQPQKTVRQAASNQPAPLPMQAQTQETRKPLVLSAKKNTANGIHNQPPHNKRQPAAPMPKKRPPQPVIERNFNTLDESQNHAPLPVQKRKWHNRGGYVEVPQPPQPKPLFDDADRW